MQGIIIVAVLPTLSVNMKPANKSFQNIVGKDQNTLIE